MAQINIQLDEFKYKTEEHSTEILRVETNALNLLSDVNKLAPKSETRAIARELEAMNLKLQQCALHSNVELVSYIFDNIISDSFSALVIDTDNCTTITTDAL